MGKLLEALKAKAAELEKKKSETKKDKGGENPYNIDNLTDDKYLLGKLPKDLGAASIVTDDGEFNVDEFTKTLQRQMFLSMKAIGEEMVQAVKASNESLKEYVEAKVDGSLASLQEKDIVFFDEKTPLAGMKNSLAALQYKELKEQFPEASVQELRSAAIEIVNEQSDSTAEELLQKQLKEASDTSHTPDFSDLLDGLDIDIDTGEDTGTGEDEGTGNTGTGEDTGNAGTGDA